MVMIGLGGGFFVIVVGIKFDIDVIIWVIVFILLGDGIFVLVIGEQFSIILGVFEVLNIWLI